MKKMSGIMLTAALAMVAGSPAFGVASNYQYGKEIVDVNGPTGARLTDVIGKGFIVGDKLFCITGFTSSANDGMGGTPDMPAYNPDNITIRGLDFGLSGIGFQMEGAFGDIPDSFISDMTLTYDVTVLPEYADQGYRITDNHLYFDGFAVGDGSFASVTESTFDENGHNVGSMFVYDDGSTIGADKSSDEVYFDEGHITLNVVKDITFFAHEGNNGIANGSVIRQLFSQVPTPGAVALAGLAGLVGVRRRRA